MEIFSNKTQYVLKIIHTFVAKYEKTYKLYNYVSRTRKIHFWCSEGGERGQIVIPKEAREIYGIKAGDSLLVLGDSKGMAVLKTEIFQDKIDEMLGGD